MRTKSRKSRPTRILFYLIYISSPFSPPATRSVTFEVQHILAPYKRRLQRLVRIFCNNPMERGQQDRTVVSKEANICKMWPKITPTKQILLANLLLTDINKTFTFNWCVHFSKTMEVSHLLLLFFLVFFFCLFFVFRFQFFTQYNSTNEILEWIRCIQVENGDDTFYV